jgi:hypothetical protein
MSAAARLLSPAEAAESAAWSGLCGPADLFCTAAWLAVEMERVGPWITAEHACLLHPDNAGLMVQKFDRSVTDITCRVDKMLAAHLTGASAADLETALMPSAMCGGWFNSRVLATERSGAARRELVDQAEEVARGWAAESIFFPYVSAEETELRAVLEEAGYARAPALARHVLSCDYPSYDDYLSALPSRRRVRIRKELRAFAEAGVVTRAQPLDEGNVRTVAELADKLELKYGQEIDPERTLLWFTAIAKNVPTTVFTAELDGRTFAMSMWLHHGGRMYGFHAGFDYQVGDHLPMYSVVAFHLPIAQGCADPGIDMLEYGISTDQAKLLRGTTAIPQHLYVKSLNHRVPWVSAALAASTR